MYLLCRRFLLHYTREIDARMMVQLSGFTLHDSPSALETLDAAKSSLQQILIPKEAKPRLRQQLQSLRIRKGTIFPDLDHLAQVLKSDLIERPGNKNSNKNP